MSKRQVTKVLKISNPLAWTECRKCTHVTHKKGPAPRILSCFIFAFLSPIFCSYLLSCRLKWHAEIWKNIYSCHFLYYCLKFKHFTLYQHSYFAPHVLKPIHFRSSITQPHWGLQLSLAALLVVTLPYPVESPCLPRPVTVEHTSSVPSLICYTHLVEAQLRLLYTCIQAAEDGWKNKTLVLVISLEVYLDQTLGPPCYTSLVNLLSGCLSWLLFPSCADYQWLPFC